MPAVTALPVCTRTIEVHWARRDDCAFGFEFNRWLRHDEQVRLGKWAPLGQVYCLALAIIGSGIPLGMLGYWLALFNELYPADVRGAGVGFCYNFGRVLSAVFPFLVGHMSESMSLGSAIGIDAASHVTEAQVHAFNPWRVNEDFKLRHRLWQLGDQVRVEQIGRASCRERV